MILSWGVEADPTAQGRIKGAKPVAVLDIGSNSVRLVVYERLARALTPLYNEKFAAALGRGVSATGRIGDDNIARAIKAVRRFALVTRLMQVGSIYILATSAVRESENGAEFADQVSKMMGASVQVLTGAEEAHFAALGIVSGIPEFSGIVGDLGGGSLEFSGLKAGMDSVGETHQLGAIRLQDDSNNSPETAVKIARERLEKSKLISQNSGGSFAAIGGTWRALAKVHQKREKYLLHMVQYYQVPAKEIIKLCGLIIAAAEDNEKLDGMEVTGAARRDLLPYGAAALAEILKAGKFDHVVFSALGVREGYLFGELAETERELDPLLQGAEELSLLRSRSPQHALDLIDFTSQFVQAADLRESASETRMRTAACLLSDIGWRGHPDYRAEQAIDLVAYGSLAGIDHPGRAFISEVLAVRYMGLKHKSLSANLFKLSGDAASRRARTLGALLRVAYPMSAAMPGVIGRTKLVVESDNLVLLLPRDLEFLDGERLQSRLGQLASTIGMKNSQVRIA